MAPGWYPSFHWGGVFLKEFLYPNLGTRAVFLPALSLSKWKDISNGKYLERGSDFSSPEMKAAVLCKTLPCYQKIRVGKGLPCSYGDILIDTLVVTQKFLDRFNCRKCYLPSLL